MIQKKYNPQSKLDKGCAAREGPVKPGGVRAAPHYLPIAALQMDLTIRKNSFLE